MKDNFYIIKLVWKACPGRVIIDFLNTAFGYAEWVFFSVVFIKYIMRHAENERDFSGIVLFIAVSVLFFGVTNIIKIWYEAEYGVLTDAVLYEKINRMLFDKASEVELACYEDTEFYNKYTLAMKETDTRVRSVLRTASAIICGVVAGVGVLINMFMIDNFVVLFVISPLIGNFVFGRLLNKTMFRKNKEGVPYVRRMDYVNRAVYLPDYAKEIRMSGIINVLMKTYDEGFAGIIGLIGKYRNKIMSLAFLRNIFTFLIIFQGVMFYSVYRTMVTHSITLSDFAVLSSAMVSASWILINLSNDIIASYENGLYIKNLRHFLEYESKMPENRDGLSPLKDFEELSFRSACFTYNGQNKPALNDITMTIRRGEKIALVGHNGAGKTTYTKLLMRLYDVTQGEILYSHKNIKDYRLTEYRNLFAAAFQDYQVFSMTVAENVLMRKPENEADYELVKASLIKSGVYDKVSQLTKGMDTVLTREFDEQGAVLSGGELQKIAVARVFAKDYSIAVLDEPSSALDPVAEFELYESIMQACKDKTVVFISHRLSTAVLADCVYMMENGEIIEKGTHGELMLKNRKYADMFRKQAENYRYGDGVL